MSQPIRKYTYYYLRECTHCSAGVQHPKNECEKYALDDPPVEQCVFEFSNDLFVPSPPRSQQP